MQCSPHDRYSNVSVIHQGTEKLIPDVLEAFLKWLRREDTDFEGNLDHKYLGHEIPDWDLLENAG